jgi:RimJ/RimL family protein N-acetyltransferase
MAVINSDSKVMAFFPSIQSKQHTEQFVESMKNQFSKNRFCYFAVDKLENNEFIGFIGIAEQNFESDFTPCVDIGWRLAQKEWGKGYATEGAKECLDYAFNHIGLTTIKAICPIINHKSEHVMEKLGMKKKNTFNHPLLKEYPKLENCVVYEKERK